MALVRKMTCILRHPIGLRKPVCIHNSRQRRWNHDSITYMIWRIHIRGMPVWHAIHDSLIYDSLTWLTPHVRRHKHPTATLLGSWPIHMHYMTHWHDRHDISAGRALRSTSNQSSEHYDVAQYPQERIITKTTLNEKAGWALESTSNQSSKHCGVQQPPHERQHNGAICLCIGAMQLGKQVYGLHVYVYYM